MRASCVTLSCAPPPPALTSPPPLRTRLRRARLERFNLFWQTEGVELPSNSTLQVASGAQVYGGVDWVASAMSADETQGGWRGRAHWLGMAAAAAATVAAARRGRLGASTQGFPPPAAPPAVPPADLRSPEAWTLNGGVGNPASMYSHEMRELFDAAFRGDADVSLGLGGGAAAAGRLLLGAHGCVARAARARGWAQQRGAAVPPQACRRGGRAGPPSSPHPAPAHPPTPPQVRKSIIGFDVEGLNTTAAWEAGFGSLYWMEGVATRLRDKHGGEGRPRAARVPCARAATPPPPPPLPPPAYPPTHPPAHPCPRHHPGNNKLLSIMRVNNDMLCDLAALLEFDDSSLAGANATHPGQLTGRFLRYAFIPGLGVGHPAILYDEVSGGSGAGLWGWLRGGGAGPRVWAATAGVRAPPLPHAHPTSPCAPAACPPPCPPRQVSDLYWMVSNVNRDATRAWKQPDTPDAANPQLHITLFRWGAAVGARHGTPLDRTGPGTVGGSAARPGDQHTGPHHHTICTPPRRLPLRPLRCSKCEVDRSTLGLFYSPNAVSWVLAGMVDYQVSLGRHFAYPHMLVDGAPGAASAGRACAGCRC